jgi:uncharacterized protein (TIGR01244 family)
MLKMVVATFLLATGAAFAADPPASEFAKRLTPTIAIKGQLSLADIPSAQASGYTTIIDMRPDGEAADQPTATAMQSRVSAAGLSFAYVPTAPGPISEATVKSLMQALYEAKGPVLLYCRSGSRSSRVWALAEASRAGGKSSAEILARVRAVGHDVSDLSSDIERRVASRK